MPLYRIILSILFSYSFTFKGYSQYTKYINNDGRYKKVTSWGKKPSQHGLLSTQASGHVLGLCIGTNYYFGDVEFPGVVILNTLPSDWINAHLGVYAKLSYLLPFNHYTGLKTAISCGKLQANNFDFQESDKKKKQFSSFYVEPSVTFELYPLISSPKWLYFYVGFSLNYSNISYTHYTYSGFNNLFLPMIPLGFGSNFPLSRNVLWGIDIEYHLGLIDTYFSSLDSYPFMNNNHEIIGQSSNWADSYVSIGLTFSYAFDKKTCPSCHFFD